MAEMKQYKIYFEFKSSCVDELIRHFGNVGVYETDKDTLSIQEINYSEAMVCEFLNKVAMLPKMYADIISIAVEAQ